MSDTQQGPDWWQASDGKWYPPPRPDWPTAAETPQQTQPEPDPTVADAPSAERPTPEPPPTEPPPTEQVVAPPETPPAAPPGAPAPGTAPSTPPTGPPAGPPAAPPPTPPPPTGPPTQAFDLSGPPGTGASQSGDPFGTPDKNRTPLIIGGVVVAVILAIVAFVVLGGDDDGDDVATSDTTEQADDDGPSNKQGEPDESPDDAPDDVPDEPDDPVFPDFVDPDDAEPIEVRESGFTLVPDQFDDAVTDVSYGFVIANPNDELAATSVEITIGFFDEAGTAVETRSDFVSGLLGGQEVGLGGFISDVPDGIVEMKVDAEASQLVRDDIEGTLTVEDVEVTEDDFGGLTVTFTVSSDFDERVENLSLYGLFRNSAGDPIGGAVSFLEFVEPNGSSNGEIRTFIPLPDIGEAEVSVTLESAIFFD